MQQDGGAFQRSTARRGSMRPEDPGAKRPGWPFQNTNLILHNIHYAQYRKAPKRNRDPDLVLLHLAFLLLALAVVTQLYVALGTSWPMGSGSYGTAAVNSRSKFSVARSLPLAVILDAVNT
jgi:hypothetical protein